MRSNKQHPSPCMVKGYLYIGVDGLGSGVFNDHHFNKITANNSIPEPLSPGIDSCLYIEELSKKGPQAFICHFYNTYFAHIAVAAKILIGKELEFYKWDGNLPQLLQNLRDKLNKIAHDWTRDEKNHCRDETVKYLKLLSLNFQPC
ncbi:heme oxygenase 1, chloroplastic-like protein [Tanacetum coccineum]